MNKIGILRFWAYTEFWSIKGKIYQIIGLICYLWKPPVSDQISVEVEVVKGEGVKSQRESLENSYIFAWEWKPK